MIFPLKFFYIVASPFKHVFFSKPTFFHLVSFSVSNTHLNSFYSHKAKSSEYLITWEQLPWFLLKSLSFLLLNLF